MTERMTNVNVMSIDMWHAATLYQLVFYTLFQDHSLGSTAVQLM
jgi:hypothetical protein